MDGLKGGLPVILGLKKVELLFDSFTRFRYREFEWLSGLWGTLSWVSYHYSLVYRLFIRYCLILSLIRTNTAFNLISIICDKMYTNISNEFTIHCF